MDAALADLSINPLLLYVACALGALGVVLAMPRRGASPALIGGLIAAAAVGLVALGLFLALDDMAQIPNLFFYVFAAMALGGGLRMITHPRPVYAALYFILTIIASSGLYLLLSAEFMAFALIIIYAGAILITYLFVIMLATQAPTDDDDESLTDYDTTSREPIAAVASGFVLLALLSTMLFRGAPALEPMPGLDGSDAILSQLPGKVEDALLEGLLERELIDETERLAIMDNGIVIDSEARRVLVATGVAPGEAGDIQKSRFVIVPDDVWPDDLIGSNVEGLGLNLLGQHPMTIEIAGVILLMAMLGATVLARKQVDLEEDAKAREARRLALEART